MGGIAGFFGARENGAALAEALGSAIRHRGPAGLAVEVLGSIGLTAVFRAREHSSDPPAVGRSRDGRVRAVLDGSILNSAELAARVGTSGTSGADLVAEVFARFGPDAFAMLDGPFAVAVDDGERLHLARDPLGEKILYSTEVGGTFLFASETKAFLAHPHFHVSPKPSSLLSVLTFSFIPGQESMFEGVSELLPGQRLVRDREGAVTRSVFWDLEESPSDRPEAECIAETRELVRRAVERRLQSGERIGAFLSGGVDSSAVVAILRDLGVSVVAFSASFGHGQPNELMYARLVAEHCGVDHRVIDVEPRDFLHILPSIMWSLDDPLCDCITVPNFLLARAAAREVDVVFNGEGGDPLFGGPKNKFLILGEWYAFLGGYERTRAYLSSYHKIYDYLDALCTPELLAAGGGSAALADVVRPYLEGDSFSHLLNRLMYVNIKLKGGQNILVKVDKMMSVNALRVASPLFDKSLTELSFAIPPRWKRRGDVEKYVFKRSVESLLPRAVVYRKKAGMGVPLNHWFRVTELREYASSILFSQRAKQRGYFRQSFIEELFSPRGTPSAVGQDRSGEMLWMLLAIELWHRVYVDGERPS